MDKIHLKRDLELKLIDTSIVQYESGFSETIEEGFSAKYLHSEDVEVEIDDVNFFMKFKKDGVEIVFGLFDISKKALRR